ncbi:MAG: Pr6Pr family membrane protein [Acidimicrobiales bacterium]
MTIRSRLDRIAPVWHLVTALVVVVGLAWQLVLVIQGVNVLVEPRGQLPAVSTRIIRFLSFFTVQSNILVAITSAALVIHSDRAGRLWRVLRLDALFGITVTGVIYSTLLRGVVELHGATAVTNALLHYVGPLMAVLGWILFGPRPRIDENTLMLSLIWPGLYVGYTFAHGAIKHWYPYPFIDVKTHGYLTVVRNGIGLIVLLVGVGALFMYFDHRMPQTPSPDRAPPPSR